MLDELRQRHEYPMVRSGPQGEAVYTGPGAGRPIRPEQSDIEVRLRMMDAAGVDQQILRVQNVGGIDAFEPDRAKIMARAVNAELSEIARKYPGRFIPFAAVPANEPEAAAQELVHAVEVLGHAGVGLSCQIAGKGLDHEHYLPLLQAAQSLGVPLLLLPNHPPLLEPALRPYHWLAGAFGFQVDLTWAVLRLLHAGVFERFPDITIIVANLGGVLSSITERLDEYWNRVHTGSDTLPMMPSEGLRGFYYETASAHPASIAAAAQLFGADRLVFGSDYPSFSLQRGVDNIRNSNLSEQEMDAVMRGNATTIFNGMHWAGREKVQ
ncbi:MAG: amidohydrolase family protein [Aquisalimonadaceae bacterium]